jgi:NADH dehydrogenase
MSERVPEVVIIGGGFAGLYAAQALASAPVRITLIDKRNFHLFQPLLYQVATGGLSPANIAAPLRGILAKQKNCRVLLGEVRDIDVQNHQVLLPDCAVPYDTLIVAAGARHHYFGKPEWEQRAPGLKTLEDATEIRARVLLAFEAAERAFVDDLRRMWTTFVIVGGGPTGVELAGAISELAKQTLRKNFRQIDPARTRIILVEGQDRVLGTFKTHLSASALQVLHRMGVEVWTQSFVKDVQDQRVVVERNGVREEIAAGTILWAAGVQGSPLSKVLAERTGVKLDRAGRVIVGPDLTVPGYLDVFVVGDQAAVTDSAGAPVPGVAPAAMQMGDYAAQLIVERLKGKTLAPFRYWDKGSMATIGRAAAVVDAHWMTLTGYLAWLAWLFVHIFYLIRFENRIMVMFQWGWNYLTRGRSARLITGDKALHRADLGVHEVQRANQA